MDSNLTVAAPWILLVVALILWHFQQKMFAMVAILGAIFMGFVACGNLPSIGDITVPLP